MKEHLRKNPLHGFTKNIILTNLYVRLPKQQKDILDNSSRGSFTNNIEVTKSFANKFGLDPYVFIEVTKSFANHIDVPKKNFKIYVEPIKRSVVVPKVVK